MRTAPARKRGEGEGTNVHESYGRQSSSHTNEQGQQTKTRGHHLERIGKEQTGSFLILNGK